MPTKTYSTGRFGSAAALCCFLFATATVELGSGSYAEASPGVPEPVEREMILDMVREYRRSNDSLWLETLADTIYDESVRAAVDPLLVASIVAKESSFLHTAVSPAGAVGLMQLRPAVADDLAGRTDVEWSGPEALNSPAINLRLGILYYKELMERFEGDAAKALTAYNFGPTRVSRQLRDGTYAGSAYADSVLSFYDRLDASRAL